MKRFLMRTMGCQMNEYDSERVAALLLHRGWIRTNMPEEADLFIINTCSVREKPLHKVFSQAGRFNHRRRSPDIPIYIMGCVAQQFGKDAIKPNGHIDGVFSPEFEHMIPEAAEHHSHPVVHTRTENTPRTTSAELFPEASFTPTADSISSFISVMRGCNNYCTYCIVPFLRGPEISRPAATIEKQVAFLVSQGVIEITLIGQNVNSYHDPETHSDFVSLLHRIAAVPGVRRIRFVTSHPKDFGPELARCFKDIDQLMPYLHLPAQSGSDTVLSRMKRGYSRDDYIRKIDGVRTVCPDISVSSDFIVGFPGESADEFFETLSLLDRIKYDMVFAFAYSPRPMTKAAHTMNDSVPETEKLTRLNTLLDNQRDIIETVRRRFLHRTVHVLVEGPSRTGGTMKGRSEHNIVTHIKSEIPPDRGSIVPVQITEVLKNTLRGDMIQ